MKTQQNFQVKMEMMGGEDGKSKQMKKSMLDKREKTQVKTSSEAAKANNNFFCVHYLALFLLNCQDGIQSSKAQERIVERTMKTKLF